MVWYFSVYISNISENNDVVFVVVDDDDDDDGKENYMYDILARLYLFFFDDKTIYNIAYTLHTIKI